MTTRWRIVGAIGLAWTSLRNALLHCVLFGRLFVSGRLSMGRGKRQQLEISMGATAPSRARLEVHTWAPCHDVIRRRMTEKADPALDDTTAATQGTSTNGPVIEAGAGHPSGWPAALSHFGRSSGQAKQPCHRARQTSQPASQPASCKAAALYTQQAKNKFDPNWQLVADFVAG